MVMANENVWKTPGIVEALKENFSAGMTMGENTRNLNKLFGVNASRNAVIGKCNRLGLVFVGVSNLSGGRDAPMRHNGQIGKKLKVKPTIITKAPEPEAVIPVTEEIKPVAVVAFDPLAGRFPRVASWQLPVYGQCKYIIDGQEHHEFICTHEAERRVEGGFTSWCSHHAARVHKRAPEAVTGEKETAVR
jgi:hypothetical protein